MGLSLAFNSDFDFYSDNVNKFISFIIGFLMYSAAITIMSCLFTHNLTSSWSKVLNGHFTVEFQSNIDGTKETLTDKQLGEVSAILKSIDEIKSVKRLYDGDILKILEPWLKNSSIPDDFPFPVLFAIESHKDVKLDIMSLTEKLSKVSSGVKIHDHSSWYAPILKISNGLFLFAILLSVFIFIAVCSTVVFITKKTLNYHEDVVKILQLIGANNLYIASQFKRYYFSIGIKASIMSIVLSVLTIFGILHFLSHELDVNMLKYTAVSFGVSVITTILVMITAKSSVIFFLKNDKWIG